LGIEKAGGELEASEVASCLLRVDGGGAQCVEDLGESEPDGSVIVKLGELEGPRGRDGPGFGLATGAGVKVAEAGFAHGRRSAALSVGLDAVTKGDHDLLPFARLQKKERSRNPHSQGLRRMSAQNSGTQGLVGKMLRASEL